MGKDDKTEEKTPITDTLESLSSPLSMVQLALAARMQYGPMFAGPIGNLMASTKEALSKDPEERTDLLNALGRLVDAEVGSVRYHDKIWKRAFAEATPEEKLASLEYLNKHGDTVLKKSLNAMPANMSDIMIGGYHRKPMLPRADVRNWSNKVLGKSIKAKSPKVTTAVEAPARGWNRSMDAIETSVVKNADARPSSSPMANAKDAGAQFTKILREGGIDLRRGLKNISVRDLGKMLGPASALGRSARQFVMSLPHGIAMDALGTTLGNVALMSLVETGMLDFMGDREDNRRYANEFIFGKSDTAIPNVDPVTSLWRASQATSTVKDQNVEKGRHDDTGWGVAKFTFNELHDAGWEHEADHGDMALAPVTEFVEEGIIGVGGTTLGVAGGAVAGTAKGVADLGSAGWQGAKDVWNGRNPFW